MTDPAGFDHKSCRVQSQIQQAFITDPAGFYHRFSSSQSQIQQGLITDPAGFNHRSSRVHSQTSRVMSQTQQGYITDPGGLDHRSSRVQSDPAGFNHKSRRLNPMTWLSAVHHTTTRPGVGVTKSIFSVPLFSYFFSIAKLHVSYWVSHSYLICQIWMRYKESNGYFGRIENLACGEINEWSFSNPHPRGAPPPKT